MCRTGGDTSGSRRPSNARGPGIAGPPIAGCQGKIAAPPRADMVDERRLYPARPPISGGGKERMVNHVAGVGKKKSTPVALAEVVARLTGAPPWELAWTDSRKTSALLPRTGSTEAECAGGEPGSRCLLAASETIMVSLSRVACPHA